MALIKCPECGKEISDRAEACPNCAYPIAKLNKNNTVAQKESHNTDAEKHIGNPTETDNAKSLEEELRAREEHRRKRQEAVRIKKQKAKKRKTIIASCIAAILVLVSSIFVFDLPLNIFKNKKEIYESALSYAEKEDYLIAYELLEECLNYRDSQELCYEYKYAYAMDLLGFADQFHNPKIQDNYDLTLYTVKVLEERGDEYFIIENNYLEAFKDAKKLLIELNEIGYGKNVEYLIELVEPEIVRGENLKGESIL